MEYTGFLSLFEAETKDILEKNQWEFYTDQVFDAVKKLPEALGRVLISCFANAVSEGEVRQEIFSSNLLLLLDYARNYNDGNAKYILSTNIKPELYLSEADLFDKIKIKFDSVLQKTEEVKKKVSDMPDLDMGKLMEMMGAQGHKKQNTKTKRKKR